MSQKTLLSTIYIPDIDKKGWEVYASISFKLYLINKLKANMLIGNNVLCTEDFAINSSIFSALINSRDVKIDINVREHSKFSRQKTLASSYTIVPSVRSSSHFSTCQIVGLPWFFILSFSSNILHAVFPPPWLHQHKNPYAQQCKTCHKNIYASPAWLRHQAAL